MSDRVRVAIVGAGPQGLTTALYLVEAGVRPDDIVVLDPNGQWLSRWREQFDRLGIAHLRSPSVHHPHPDPYALATYAADHGRNGELLHRYRLPSTALFEAFCWEAIHKAGLADVVRAASVIGVTSDGRVTLSDGSELLADHVVWATNPARVDGPVGIDGVVPWFSVDVSVHTSIDTEAMTVAVVGGGLTAAHLVERALERGHHVEWISRRPVVEREFDTDPGWLGPKEMTAFGRIENPRDRLVAVLAARGGGSVPSWMLQRLTLHERAGRLCRRAGAVEVGADGRGPVVAVDGMVVRPDVVWTAWGDSPCAQADPALHEICVDRSVDLVGGRPVLDRALRLPGTQVHVVGRLAQLELGPTAGNLAGARRAAELVVGSVCGADAMYALMDA